MGLGAEIIMAVVGLWGVYLRPLLMRYAGDMAEVMGHAMHRIVRARPSFVNFLYLSSLFFLFPLINFKVILIKYASSFSLKIVAS